MGEWKAIVPFETTNKIRDPQFYFSPSTYWSVSGDGTSPSFSQDSAQQMFGPWSAMAVFGSGTTYIDLRQSGNPSGNYVISAYVRRDGGGVVSSTQVWLILNSNNNVPDLIEDVGNGWYRVSYAGAHTTGTYGVRARENGLRIDGVQMELGTTLTTYCDGTQPGCIWLGGEWNGYSYRSGESRGGGEIKDLKDDYNFGVATVEGLGMAPIDFAVDEFAALPGGRLNSIRSTARGFSLVGPLTDPTGNLHDKRQAIIEVLRYDAYPLTVQGAQPAMLRYDAPSVRKYIRAHLVGGLEGRWDEATTGLKTQERLALQFIMDDPAVLSDGEKCRVLDVENSSTLTHIVRRNFQTGMWDNLGNPSNTGQVYAIAEDDQYIYLGGDFTDWSGISYADRFVAYNKYSEAWEAFQQGFGTGVTRAIVADGKGGVWAFGSWTQTGTGSTVNYISYWNGSAWVAVDGGASGQVRGACLGHDGNIYITGLFTSAGGTTVNYAAYIDSPSGSWTAMGSGPGLNNYGYSCCTAPDGRIYFAGDFTAENGGSAGDNNRCIRWNPNLSTPAWEYVGDLNNQATMVAAGPSGRVYYGGIFTTADGNTVNRIAEFYGTGFRPMGGGLNGSCDGIAVGRDGLVWITGAFTQAGELPIGSTYLVLWNGSSYAYVDVKMPGSLSRGVVHPSPYRAHPVNNRSYDVWFGPGMISTGTGYYGGNVDAENPGSMPQYPTLSFHRSGGTQGIVKVVRNVRTGAELFLNIPLQDGERVMIDTHPNAKTVMSNVFGSRPDYVLPGSDFGTFSLLPGTNTLVCFVDTAGSPTITAYCLIKPAYDGVD